MFRKMHRKKQKLSIEECEKLLHDGTSGVLSLCGNDGYPYGVPLSYVYDDSRLIFHCATEGRKLDIIRENPKASFCVIGKDQIVSDEYTTYFQSVMVSGSVKIIENAQEKQAAAEILGLRYAPDDSHVHLKEVIRHSWKRLCMLEMSIDHISGKQAIELAASKQ